MKRFVYILILIAGCKDVYNPHVAITSTGYLVVEGNIVAGNDSTFIHLTRSVPVADTSIVQPETNATVKVESDDGDSYQLQNENNGIYDAPPLNININKNYRVHIFTADGTEYASDYVPVKITPPIDSLSWKFKSDSSVSVYVSAYDAQNKTLYYLWNFIETWQHRTTYTSGLIYENGTVRFRKPDEYINNCWTILPSSSINIATTTQLSSDIVYENPLVTIPYGDEKLSIVYSIQAKQFAITKDAFEFWGNLKKNTENLGTIFDPQPFADFGNIHCITKPSEPVIGFISAGSEQEQRIYIRNSDLPSWGYRLPVCELDTLMPGDDLFSWFASNSFIPLYSVALSGTTETGLLVTAAECGDCRVHGGSTIKPPYMP